MNKQSVSENKSQKSGSKTKVKSAISRAEAI